MSALDHKLNTMHWQFCTNRHTTTNGHSWGWIENHPNHLCWSDDARDHRKDTITSKEASDLVSQHNQWLLDSRSTELKLLELNNEKATAFLHANALTKQLEEAGKQLSAIEEKIKTLQPTLTP